MVVVVTPTLSLLTSLFNVSEPMLVQAFVSELAILPLDKRIPRWLTWWGKFQIDACLLVSEEHGFTCKFGSVVTDDLVG